MHSVTNLELCHHNNEHFVRSSFCERKFFATGRVGTLYLQCCVTSSMQWYRSWLAHGNGLVQTRIAVPSVLCDVINAVV
jgi:hypothetical protein